MRPKPMKLQPAKYQLTGPEPCSLGRGLWLFGSPPSTATHVAQVAYKGAGSVTIYQSPGGVYHFRTMTEPARHALTCSNRHLPDWDAAYLFAALKLAHHYREDFESQQNWEESIAKRMGQA